MLDKCKWEISLNMEELIIIEKLKYMQLLGVLLFPLKIKLVIIIKYKNPKQMDLQDLKNSQEKELKEEQFKVHKDKDHKLNNTHLEEIEVKKENRVGKHL